MSIKITTTMQGIAAATLLSVFVLILGAIEAEAMSFETFVGSDNPQVCDAYNAVFYDGQCVKLNGGGGTGEVLGDKDQAETETSVELIDNRCVGEDGVVELALENVQMYELKNRSTGDVESRGGTNADFQTFSDLSDGSYKYTGRGDHGNDSVFFTVDCDPENPRIPLVSVSCSVTPLNPEVGEEVQWESESSGGDNSYIYSWSGDVVSEQAGVSTTYDDEGEKVAYITVRSAGQQDTARCSVNVSEDDVGDDDDGEDDGGGGRADDDDGEEDETDEGTSTFSRSIEEF